MASKTSLKYHEVVSRTSGTYHFFLSYCSAKTASSHHRRLSPRAASVKWVWLSTYVASRSTSGCLVRWKIFGMSPNSPWFASRKLATQGGCRDAWKDGPNRDGAKGRCFGAGELRDGPCGH